MSGANPLLIRRVGADFVTTFPAATVRFAAPRPGYGEVVFLWRAMDAYRAVVEADFRAFYRGRPDLEGEVPDGLLAAWKRQA